MAHSPPIIEGTLKSTISSLGFGLISTVLSITFGKCFIPNFFLWIAGFVVLIEFVLFSIPRKPEEYELYQDHGRKVKHHIEGSGAQISIYTPDEEDSPKKKAGIRERFKKDKQGKKDLIKVEAATKAGEGTAHISSPKKSPKTERTAAKEHTQKVEKVVEKAEGQKAEKKKEKNKARGDSVDNMAENQDGEMNKSKDKGGWKTRISHRKSQSLTEGKPVQE